MNGNQKLKSGKNKSASPVSISRGLELVGVSRRNILSPSFLRAVESILSIVILAAWLPLLHVVITNELKLGHKFQIFENLLPESGKLGILLIIGAFIIAATAVKIFCTYLVEKQTAVLSGRAEATLAEKIIRSHLRFGQGYFDAIHPGRTIRNLKRLPARSAKLIRWLIRVNSTLLLLGLYLLLMAWLSLVLTVISFFLFLIYHITLKRYLDRSEDRLLDEDNEDDESDSDTRDIAENLLLLRLHVPEMETVKAFRDRTDRRAVLRERRSSLSGLIDELRDGGNVLLMLGFVIGAGWMLQGMSHADVARYLVFFLVFRRAIRPFATLQKLPRQWQSIQSSLGEVEDLLAEEGKAKVTGGTRMASAVAKGLTARGLHFSYDTNRPVLCDLSFEIKRGELTVLVGDNGSGKSTLLKLFLRLYEVSPGTLFLDEHDVREYDVENLRRISGYTEAEPMLLNASLRVNLTLGIGDVTEEELRQAIEDVGMADLVRAVENGLDHQIGNRGMRLSQGQRQKLALARTLLRHPAMILLDEASSSLDASSEAVFMNMLNGLTRDRIVVAVTHRVTGIPEHAHVIVLKEGRVVEDGYVRDLCLGHGPFRQMLEASRLNYRHFPEPQSTAG